MTGHALLVWHWDPFWALGVSTLSALLLGLLFGVIALRRQGIYFAMITLALSQIVYFFFLQAPFTGGEDGLQGIPRQALLGVIDLQSEWRFLGVSAAWGLFGLVFCVFVLVHLAILLWLNSPSGLVMAAIRSHENRARSLGLPTLALKRALFSISAMLAGLAGGLKALVLGLASLSDAAWSLSGEVVLMNLLGGVGTFMGPAIGAFFLRTLHHEFAELGAWFTVVLGATFIVCVMVFRRGLVGECLVGMKRLGMTRKLH
jgi:branched-chain amino acid transport system permease protein